MNRGTESIIVMKKKEKPWNGQQYCTKNKDTPWNGYLFVLKIKQSYFFDLDYLQ